MGSLKLNSQGSLPSILDDVERNSEGILRLQENKTYEAIEAFTIGLRSVIATLQTLAETTDNIVDWKQSSFPFQEDILFSVDLPERRQACCCDSGNEGSDCRFTIYTRALQLKLLSGEPHPSLIEAYYQLLCSLLLYNIGLANHLIAMETGNCSTMLSRALGFYSMAHRTIPNDPPPSSLQGSGRGLNLAYLAVANNVGHIHCVHCEHKKTHICADEIYDRLCFLFTSSDEIQEEYRLFMMNASFFSVTDTLPAHAA